MYAVCCAIPDNDTPQVHDPPVWENWGCLEAMSFRPNQPEPSNQPSSLAHYEAVTVPPELP